MGHGYGLDHSRRDGWEQDYQDPWDTMSTDNAYEADSEEYGSIGPGLNAANMRSRGWLDEERVWKPGSNSFDVTIKLRPLHRHDLPGFLAADFMGNYLVEYRKRARWDAGIPRSAVLIHRFEDNHSYVMANTEGTLGLVKGDVFQIGGSAGQFAQQTSFTRIEVISIDDGDNTATIRLVFHPAQKPALTIDPFVGMTEDGFMFHGQLHPIPRWAPLFKLLQAVAAYQNTATIQDLTLRQAARREALESISKQVSELKKPLDPVRVPAKRKRPERF
jgi:hypothetical protein